MPRRVTAVIATVIAVKDGHTKYKHLQRLHYWASEASPTLGCSIEISRDICCRYVVCRMSVVCQINCVGGITCGPRACSKSFFWRLNQCYSFPIR